MTLQLTDRWCWSRSTWRGRTAHVQREHRVMRSNKLHISRQLFRAERGKFTDMWQWWEGLLDNSRIRQLVDCQLADWTSRALVNSRTGQVADWTTRGYRLYGYKITYRIIVFKYARRNINKWLNNNIQLIVLWNTSIWHNNVFYVHIIIYLKLQLLPATSASGLGLNALHSARSRRPTSCRSL